MKRILFCMVLFTVFIDKTHSQVVPNIDWVQNYSERDQIANIPSAIDANDNVYITGNTFSGSGFNITTLKYNRSGRDVFNNGRIK